MKNSILLKTGLSAIICNFSCGAIVQGFGSNGTENRHKEYF